MFVIKFIDGDKIAHFDYSIKIYMKLIKFDTCNLIGLSLNSRVEKSDMIG